MQKLAEEIKELEEAYNIFNDALVDDATRYRALSREKGLRDKISTYYDRFEQGKAEGLAEGKVEIARNLKKEGFGSKKISKLTGLSIEEIETL